MMRAKNSYLKNVTHVIASDFFSKFLSAGLVFFMTRILGAVIFGMWSYVLTVFNILEIVAEFGTDKYFLSENAKDGESFRKKMLGSGMILRIILAFSVFLLAMHYYILFARNTADGRMIACYAAVVIIIPVRISWFFDSINRFDISARGSVIDAVIFVSSALLLVQTPEDVFWLPVCKFSGVLAACMYYVFTGQAYFKDMQFRADFKKIGTLAQNSVPFFVSFMIVFGTCNIDILMLKWLKGDFSVAMYAAAYKVLFFVYRIRKGIADVFLPDLIKFMYSDRSYFEYMCDLLMKAGIYIGIPLVVVLQFFASEFTVLLFGREFSSSAGILRILIFLGGFAFFNLIFGYLIRYAVRPWLYNTVYFSTILLNILLNYHVIPQYDYTGAAIVTVICEVVSLTMMFFFFRKNVYSFSLKKYLGFWVKPFILNSVIAGCLLLTLNTIDVSLPGIVSLSVFTGVFWYVGIYFFDTGFYNNFKELALKSGKH